MERSFLNTMHDDLPPSLFYPENGLFESEDMFEAARISDVTDYDSIWREQWMAVDSILREESSELASQCINNDQPEGLGQPVSPGRPVSFGQHVGSSQPVCRGQQVSPGQQVDLAQSLPDFPDAITHSIAIPHPINSNHEITSFHQTTTSVPVSPIPQKGEYQRVLCEWEHHVEEDIPQKSEAVSAILSSLRTCPNKTPSLKQTIDELYSQELIEDLQPILGPTEAFTIPPQQQIKKECEVVQIPSSLWASGDMMGKDDIVNMPLLLTGDLTDLLQQFEEQQGQEGCQELESGPAPPSSPPRPSSKTIRDLLPEEVINRIKASRENHKKKVAVIPAIPNKKRTKAATRMQDAGIALSRNKMLKSVSRRGTSALMDHDYCSNSSGPSSSSGSTPEHHPIPADQRLQDLAVAPDCSSRKDSGLGSGSISEEDSKVVSMQNLVQRGVESSVQPGEQTSGPNRKVLLQTSSGVQSVNIVSKSNMVACANKSLGRTNVSLLKKNCIKSELDLETKKSKGMVENKSRATVRKQCDETVSQDKIVFDNKEQKEKRKLNLEEYRKRREEREKMLSQRSSRASSPGCSTPTGSVCSTKSTNSTVTRPLMHSVEVQTNGSDVIDLTTRDSPAKNANGRSKERRKAYFRHDSQSSSSNSSWGTRVQRHRSKRRSRSRKKHRRSTSRKWSPRSRSRSRSSSRSYSRSRSRSRSRPRSREGRQRRRNNSPHHSSSYRSRTENHGSDWSYSRSRSPARRNSEFGAPEKALQVEERRVVYVGRIKEGTSRTDLRMRFQQFGPIVDISVHFRDFGDNYGFVTFACKADAYRAVEHGNDDRTQPHYDLCFGGRRAFCKQKYADLDGMASNNQHQYHRPRPQQRPSESFDSLLQGLKAQLRKRVV